MIESPLFAESAKEKDFPNIKYPVIGSPKLDGIRCLIVDGKAVSRNFKEIPNKFIASTLPTLTLSGFDGELLLKKITKKPAQNKKKDPYGITYEKEVKNIENLNKLAENKPHLITFNYVSSEVMSFDGEPDYVYYVFDYVQNVNMPYNHRIKFLNGLFSSNTLHRLVLVPTFMINNEEELSIAEQRCIDEGFEGLMIRDPDGSYYTPRYLEKKAEGKRAENRSSFKEGLLIKIKRFTDGEAEIIGFQEAKSNQNEKEVNVFGYSERKSFKDGMVLKDTLGALLVKDIKTGVEFKIGTGLNDNDRDYFWENQEKELGQIVKYKSQPSGEKDKPRFPVYLGKRHANDMS